MTDKAKEHKAPKRPPLRAEQLRRWLSAPAAEAGAGESAATLALQAELARTLDRFAADRRQTSAPVNVRWQGYGEI